MIVVRNPSLDREENTSKKHVSWGKFNVEQEWRGCAFKEKERRRTICPYVEVVLTLPNKPVTPVITRANTTPIRPGFLKVQGLSP